MDAVRVCSLGQISQAFFEVGGQYRRSLSSASAAPPWRSGPSEQAVAVTARRLPFDPVAEARRLWSEQGWGAAAPAWPR